MAENCAYAYRKRGDVSVHCKLINGQFDYCTNMYMCSNTKRWEVNKAAQCAIRFKGKTVN